MRGDLILPGGMASVFIILGHGVVGLREAGQLTSNHGMEGSWAHHVTNRTGIIIVKVIAVDINVIVSHGV